MHGLIVGVVVSAAIVAGSGPRAAGPGPGHTVICSAQTHICIVTATTSPGAPENGSTTGGSTGNVNVGSSGGAQPPDPCSYRLTDPQPPASDPIWAGHPPGSGAVYEHVCPSTIGTLIATPIFVPNGAAVPVVVTPAQLAREAVAQVKLPSPTIERSPSADNTDQGMPYTWVNLWTWFWTSPQTWRPLTRTASAGAVWAQVTVRPDRLVFDPGDGEPSVECAGPGRPWREADANIPPSDGGCGYLYRHVTTSGPVSATVSIRWAVTWVGSGGAAGTLPQMTTSATSQFVVEQIQAVMVR